jgi:hypothetical protein
VLQNGPKGFTYG